MPPPGGHLPHQDPSGPPHSPRFLPSAPPLAAAAMVAKHSLGLLHCPIPSRAPRVPPRGQPGLLLPCPGPWHSPTRGLGLAPACRELPFPSVPPAEAGQGSACFRGRVHPVCRTLQGAPVPRGQGLLSLGSPAGGGLFGRGLVSLQLFLQEPRLCLAACRAGSAPRPTGEPGPAGWSSPGLPQPSPSSRARPPLPARALPRACKPQAPS